MKMTSFAAALAVALFAAGPALAISGTLGFGVKPDAEDRSELVASPLKSEPGLGGEKPAELIAANAARELRQPQILDRSGLMPAPDKVVVVDGGPKIFGHVDATGSTGGITSTITATK